MLKINIPRSEETIKKEEKEAKIKLLKDKKNVSNEDLKDLLIEVLEKIG